MPSYEVLVEFDYQPDGQSESVRVEPGDVITDVEVNESRANELIALGVIALLP